MLGSTAGPARVRAGSGVSALIERLELGEHTPPRPMIDFTLPALAGGQLAMTNVRC